MQLRLDRSICTRAVVARRSDALCCRSSGVLWINHGFVSLEGLFIIAPSTSRRVYYIASLSDPMG